MAEWAKPAHTRNAVKKAGRSLTDWWLGRIPDPDYEAVGEAIRIVSNFRASHAFPLNTFQTTLRNRARRYDPAAIVGQRLKRLESIVKKLDRFPNMALTTMGDLGGCRAVVETVTQMRSLQQDYLVLAMPLFPGFEVRDYIDKPKPDGYRGIHLTCRYQTNREKLAAWNDLRIEIQIRSRIQHAFATAVEVVDLFTGHHLKLGSGDTRWRRFFALMGTALAIKEDTQTVEDTPANRTELRGELEFLEDQLHIIDSLTGWRHTIPQVKTTNLRHAAACLVKLDLVAHAVTVEGYRDRLSAEAAYDAAERESATKVNVVLVSVGSLRELERLFPNYFADTEFFTTLVRAAMSA